MKLHTPYLTDRDSQIDSQIESDKFKENSNETLTDDDGNTMTLLDSCLRQDRPIPESANYGVAYFSFFISPENRQNMSILLSISSV